MNIVSTLKTSGRVVALALLLLAMTGTWLYDSHPATEDACAAPLVWLGGGFCACLMSFYEMIRVIHGEVPLWTLLLFLLPALPVLSTLFLLVFKHNRYLFIFHLVVWALTAVLSLLIFLVYSHRVLILWGAGFGFLVAILALASEIIVAKSKLVQVPPGGLPV